MPDREVFIEAARLGDVMKVSAIDPETGLEATAIGPAHARADLEALAVKKLKRLLEGGQMPGPARPGTLV